MGKGKGFMRLIAVMLFVILLAGMAPAVAGAADYGLIYVPPDRLYGAEQGSSITFLISLDTTSPLYYNNVQLWGDLYDYDWHGYPGLMDVTGWGPVYQEDENMKAITIEVADGMPTGIYNAQLLAHALQTPEGYSILYPSNSFAFHVWPKGAASMTVTPSSSVFVKWGGYQVIGSVQNHNFAWNFDHFINSGDPLDTLSIGNLNKIVTVNGLPGFNDYEAFLHFERFPDTPPVLLMVTSEIPIGKHRISITCDGVTSNEFEFEMVEESSDEDATLRFLDYLLYYYPPYYENNLYPAFNPEVTAYTVRVPNSASTISLLAETNDPRATVSGAEIKPLAVGDNTFFIEVTAADGITTKEYAIMVTREEEIDRIDLSYYDTPINPGEEEGNWLKGTTMRHLVFDAYDESGKSLYFPEVSWDAFGSNIRSLLIPDLYASGAILSVGRGAGGGWDEPGTIRVSSKADPAIYDEVEIRIFDYFVDLSSHASDINPINRGDSVQLSYTVYGYGGPYTNFPGVHYELTSPDTDTITDTVISPGGVLLVGENEQAKTLLVTPLFEQNYTGVTPGGETYYSRGTAFVLEGDLSDDATLSALSVNAGTLSPAFSPAITNYAVAVPYSVSSIGISATANHAAASVSGAGTKTLAVGANPFSVVVTAENGVTKRTYTVVVTREEEEHTHVWVDATCTTPKTCSACGETEGSALGHDWGTWSTTSPATCNIAGLETRVCANDPAHRETRTIPALGHDWGAWSTTSPATCNIAGLETRVCANDPTHIETRTIFALGHAWGAWTVTTPAACETTGVETRVCAYDSAHIETRAIPALEHDWDDGEVTIPPTQEEEGEMTYTCTLCGDTRTEAIPKLPGTPVNSDAEFLREIATDVIQNGLSQSNLILSGKTLTFAIDGRAFVLSVNANNRNTSGEIALGDGYYLVFDIKGNGSNIKEFRVIQR